MAKRIVQQLRKEVETRRAELNALEAALAALEGGGLVGNGLRARDAGKRTRKPRTPEQRAAQAERMKKIWAAKKKAGTATRKTKAKKTVRRPRAKKIEAAAE